MEPTFPEAWVHITTGLGRGQAHYESGALPLSQVRGATGFETPTRDVREAAEVLVRRARLARGRLDEQAQHAVDGLHVSGLRVGSKHERSHESARVAALLLPSRWQHAGVGDADYFMSETGEY